MNSPHQREQLPDLLSDALSPDERARVEAHLQECAQCARELRALRAMQATLTSLPDAPTPASVRANVHAALRADSRQAHRFSALPARQQNAGNQTNEPPFEPPTSRRRAPRHNALPFALPFALPVPQLAWGGAAVVATVGLMLLARPSMQNDTSSELAPVSEIEMASRSADKGAAPDENIAPAQAPASRAQKEPKQRVEAPKVARSAPGKKVAPAVTLPADVTQLPALPPPPAVPPPRTQPKANTPPRVASETPAPNLSRAQSNSNSDPTQSASRPDTARDVSAQSKNAPNTRPATGQKVAKPIQPAPKTRESSPDNPASSSGATASAPAAPAPAPSAEVADNSRADAGDREGASSFSDGTPAGDSSDMERPTARRAMPAPLPSQSSAFESEAAPVAPKTRANAAVTTAQNAASADWPGGQIDATLTRREAEPKARSGAFASKLASPQPPLLLTWSVAKAIGNARLILLLPSEPQPVWRGSMNALPVQIALPSQTAKLRPGQKIRARLEQIDGEGNPISSSTFELLVP